jgi:hypothetical protein
LRNSELLGSGASFGSGAMASTLRPAPSIRHLEQELPSKASHPSSVVDGRGQTGQVHPTSCLPCCEPVVQDEAQPPVIRNPTDYQVGRRAILHGLTSEYQLAA